MINAPVARWPRSVAFHREISTRLVHCGFTDAMVENVMHNLHLFLDTEMHPSAVYDAISA
jgi:hypothetical protein